jgi:hypothetical protein
VELIAVLWVSMGVSALLGPVGWATGRWKDRETVLGVVIGVGILRAILIAMGILTLQPYGKLDRLIPGIESQMTLVIGALLVAEIASAYGNFVMAREDERPWRAAAGWLVGTAPAVLLALGGVMAGWDQNGAGAAMLASPTVAMLGGPLLAAWKEVFPGRG